MDKLNNSFRIWRLLFDIDELVLGENYFYADCITSYSETKSGFEVSICARNHHKISIEIRNGYIKKISCSCKRFKNPYCAHTAAFFYYASKHCILNDNYMDYLLRIYMNDILIQDPQPLERDRLKIPEKLFGGTHFPETNELQNTIFADMYSKEIIVFNNSLLSDAELMRSYNDITDKILFDDPIQIRRHKRFYYLDEHEERIDSAIVKVVELMVVNYKVDIALECTKHLFSRLQNNFCNSLNHNGPRCSSKYLNIFGVIYTNINKTGKENIQEFLYSFTKKSDEYSFFPKIKIETFLMNCTHHLPSMRSLSNYFHVRRTVSLDDLYAFSSFQNVLPFKSNELHNHGHEKVSMQSDYLEELYNLNRQEDLLTCITQLSDEDLVYLYNMFSFFKYEALLRENHIKEMLSINTRLINALKKKNKNANQQKRYIKLLSRVKEFYGITL